MAIVATQENPAPTRAQEVLTAWIAAAVTAAFAVLAVALSRRPSAFVYILGAGVLFGFVAVCVRLASIHLLRGDPGGVLGLGVPWFEVAILVASGGLGVYFVQSAYQHGPPDLVVAGLTVIDPMVGVLMGIVVLGELEPGLPVWVGLCMATAGAVATLGWSRCPGTIRMWWSAVVQRQQRPPGDSARRLRPRRTSERLTVAVLCAASR